MLYLDRKRIKAVAAIKLTSEERKNKILHEVISKNEVSIQELANLFGVTTETIRKDVGDLDKRNIISKKHGSVTMVNTFLETEFSEKEGRHLEEKIKIAESALKFIPENSSIFLDTSTSILQLAKLLVMRSDLTIITNSLHVNQVLANSDNEVLVTGGLYRKKSSSYVGAWALNSIKDVSVDVSFIGCDGFSEIGPTICSYHELEIKKTIAKHSKKNIILCDTSKLKNEGLYTFSNYSDLDIIIMERKLTEPERVQFPNDIFFYS